MVGFTGGGVESVRELGPATRPRLAPSSCSPSRGSGSGRHLDGRLRAGEHLVRVERPEVLTTPALNSISIDVLPPRTNGRPSPAPTSLPVLADGRFLHGVDEQSVPVSSGEAAQEATANVDSISRGQNQRSGVAFRNAVDKVAPFAPPCWRCVLMAPRRLDGRTLLSASPARSARSFFSFVLPARHAICLPRPPAR